MQTEGQSTEHLYCNGLNSCKWQGPMLPVSPYSYGYRLRCLKMILGSLFLISICSSIPQDGIGNCFGLHIRVSMQRSKREEFHHGRPEAVEALVGTA